MAISHAQPLLLLFVSLFLLPSALGTAIEFKNCPINYQHTGAVKVTKVEIIPSYPIQYHDNPIFKITAVSSQSIGNEKLLYVTFDSLSSFNIWNRVYNLCDVTKCPIEPGRPFEITLANVSRRNDYLYGKYEASLVTHNNPIVPSPFPMCAKFKFHASDLKKFTNVPKLFNYLVKFRRVEIIPYKVTVKDNLVFRLTADTPIFISSNSTVVASMYLDEGLIHPNYSARRYKICDTLNDCPIRPGKFVLTLVNPYSLMMRAGTYHVHVVIIKQNRRFSEKIEVKFSFSVSET